MVFRGAEENRVILELKCLVSRADIRILELQNAMHE